MRRNDEVKALREENARLRLLLEGESLLKQLQRIAYMIKAFADTEFPRLDFGSVSPELLARLAALPRARRRATVYGTNSFGDQVDPYVIEAVEVVVGGVSFDATLSRPATEDERRKLDGVTPRPTTMTAVSL
jgi:hypothetical protein